MASQTGAIKRLAREAFRGVNVDGFAFQSPDVRCYILTHFHADHYCGLSAAFGKDDDEAKIYCSEITARLVVEFLGVKRERVVGCELGRRTTLRGAGTRGGRRGGDVRGRESLPGRVFGVF